MKNLKISGLALVTLLFIYLQPCQAQVPVVGPNVNLQPHLPASVRTQKMKSDARNTRDTPGRTNTNYSNQNSGSGNEKGNPSRAPEIHRSSADGRADSVSEALEEDPALIRKTDASGYTALHHAAVGGHLDVIEVLLEKGAKINARGSRGETPLLLAASKGNSEVVRLLAEKGADVNQAASDGKTPLHKAAMSGHSETISILLEAEADPSVTDRSRRTPLDLAERYRAGDAERIIRALKEASE